MIWTPDAEVAPPNEIPLATRSRQPIPNHQCLDELTALDRQAVEGFERKFAGMITRRSRPTALYNCHGMALACRRTAIDEPSVVAMILREDNYSQISQSDVLPGDLMVYYGEDGDAEHSAIVVSKPDPDLGVPWVVSKWGKSGEYVHRANQCPYNYGNVICYRVHQ